MKDPEILKLEEKISQLQSAVAELTVLNELAITASSAQEIDKIQDVIVKKSVEAVRAEQGAILLTTEEQSAPLKTLIRHEDLSSSRLLNYKVSINITGWVLANKKSLKIDNLATDDRFKTTEQERNEIRSLLCIPIRFGTKLLGILTVTNKKGGEPFTDNDLRLLTIIAAQSGQLIRNSQLQETAIQTELKRQREQFELRESEKRATEAEERAWEKVEMLKVVEEKNKELETLDDIVRTINQETVLNKVLQVLLEQGLKLFPQAEKGAFILRDGETDTFRFEAAVGYDVKEMQEVHFTEAEIVQRYSKKSQQIEKRAYIVHDFEDFEEISTGKQLTVFPKPKSLLAMAVVLEDRLEGFLVLDNLSEANAFNNSDVEKLSRFRQHAVSAIAKAKTLQTLQVKNEEIIRTQEQLVMQEKLASLGQLTAGIAHEIKNPLNFVTNFAQLSTELTDDLEDELKGELEKISEEAVEEVKDILETLRENMRAINEHGRRADNIVKGMLLHSRGVRGEFKATDLNQLIDEYLNLSYHGLRAQDPRFNCTIITNYDESIGKVMVVPQDISRVFLNILNNGFYAINEKREQISKGYVPTINVETKNLGEKIEIKFHDNGIGIPQDVSDKIFNPFFTTKPTGKGNTGLGLSISHDIVVKVHHGEITLNTEAGEFTEFTIRLPKKN